MATALANPNTETTDDLKHYLRVALDRVEPDPDQPRKTFDQAKLVELADSIKAHDVVVPIIVRPNPKKGDGHYMLIAGERRWRAAKLAGKTDIPAVVDEMKHSAGELLERQLLENSGREDVPPYEEAETYDVLMKRHGYTMDKLIEKTGRSKAHLYGRLKLLGLAPGAKKALQSGKLAPAIAELIARIADLKLQEQATRDVLGQGDSYSFNLQPERLASEEESHDATFQPLSFRASVQLLRRRYQTRFDLTRFDPLDKTLIAKVGSCDACPHRSGNQPALPGIAPAKSVDEDHCTSPKCFEAKVEATFKMKAELAKSKGLKVIEGGAAKKIISGHGGGIAYDANYVDPADELPYNLAKPGSRATFGGLLGKKLEEVPRVLVQDPNTGAARELLVKDKAIEVLKELGKVDDGRASRSPSERKADKAAKELRAKSKEKRELTEQAFFRFLDQVVAGAAKDPGGKELALWRWIARSAVKDLPYQTDERLAARRGLKSRDDLADLPDELKTLAEVRGLVAELVMGQHLDRFVDGYAGKDEKDQLTAAEKIFGASWEKALAAAKEAAKAEDKSNAAKAKKKPAKKGKKS